VPCRHYLTRLCQPCLFMVWPCFTKVDYGWTWLVMVDNSWLLFTIVDHVDMIWPCLTIANHVFLWFDHVLLRLTMVDHVTILSLTSILHESVALRGLCYGYTYCGVYRLIFVDLIRSSMVMLHYGIHQRWDFIPLWIKGFVTLHYFLRVMLHCNIHVG